MTAKYPKSQPVGAAKGALAPAWRAWASTRKQPTCTRAWPPAHQPYPLLSAARCRELSGELGAAKTLYEKLKGLKTKDEDLVQLATARLEDIALGQPLTPPPPIQPPAAPSVPALAPIIPHI